MTDWSKIVSGEELHEAAKVRKSLAEKKSKVLPSDAQILQKEGWKIVKTDASGRHTMEKEKKLDERFENEVWLVLYKMGFTHMNVDNSFRLDLCGNSKQIDVIAFDEETCVFVECKASNTFDKNTSFKLELESIHGYYPDACKAIEEKYGKKKFKQIFATYNYLISDDCADMLRINNFGFHYFNQDTVYYYRSLTEHLGIAARYQLLGNLFVGEDVGGIDNTVPAIKGVMGGIEYYSFLIEPDRLLKLSYVLHRNKANHLMMPTYQRLIKKDRLRSIRNYVENENGFFPNSIIVSVDYKDKPVCFEEFANGKSKISTSGLLYLPKQYRSIFIIDGQHRLYGYSETEKGKSETVSVVAFVNLPPEKQVSMFMEINENQKKVSKTLRNTLIIDLQWDSPDPNKRKEALLLRLAESLGEDPKSALYGRVLTGEDAETDRRCITTEYIKSAFTRTAFFNCYNNSGVSKHGTFDKGNNDQTVEYISPFLNKYFDTIVKYCAEEWNLDGKGYLATNNSIYALIRLLDDIVNIQISKAGLSCVNNIDEMYKMCEPLILDLCDTINELEIKDKVLLKEKGNSGRTKAWRALQLALNRKNADFINKELEEYIENNCTDNNPESNTYIIALEKELKKRFREELSKYDKWLFNKVPENIGTAISTRMSAENYKRQASGLEPINDEWEYITFDDIFKISIFSNNWSCFAQKLLHRKSVSGAQSKQGLTWLKNLSTYKEKLRLNKPITRPEFIELQSVYQDFCVED